MRRVTLRGLMTRKLRLGLTALAIVLGVTFVTGTLVLGDTLNRTFDNLVGNIYQHVDFEIRGKQTLQGVKNQGIDSTASRVTVPQSVATNVSKLPGVQFAYGSVSGYAQLIGHDGNTIGNANSSNGFSFDPNPQLSALRLVKGKAPTTDDEVVLDQNTVTKHHFAIGDRVRILLPNGTRTFTVSGIVKFGSADSLAGATLTGFYLPTAQRLFNSVGRYATINVLTKPGADKVAVQREIERVLPASVEVVSGQTVANELDQTIHSDLAFLSTALLIFAFIALLVGSFTIFNTFSITVGQRTRELALLRVVGASRPQIFRSVLGEAALTGLIASLIGLGLGVVAAIGLKALLGAFGITLPSAPLVFKARTPIVALIIGIGVTTLSSIVPARRAIRIPPVAALVDVDIDRSETLRPRRLVMGVIATLLGLLLIVTGLKQAQVGSVGLGALFIFIATVALVPAIAATLASALGGPLARVLGVPGRLGRRNSARNPRRTAQTAGALMIGIALVSTIGVLGSSLSSSATAEVNSALAAGYIIGGSNSISPTVARIAARVPGAKATTVVYTGPFDVRGSLQTLGAASTANLDKNVTLNIVAGQGAAAMSRGELLVDTNTAKTQNLHVGSTVPVTFAQTGPTTMRVGGIYKYNPLVGSYLTGADYFLGHFDHPLIDAVLISSAAGTQHFESALNHALRAYPNLNIQSRAQFLQSEQNSVNQLLGLIYVLLALAVLIALIGIVNTLLLSVFERTREIGLLRAVGMERRQVRWMVRAESVIIALFGAVVGIVVGTGLGLALASSLRNNGVTALSVPFGTLVIFLILSALLGLGAASWPARRAAKLDVLQAIATQ
jgi:putative ABC transport system permease protein